MPKDFGTYIVWVLTNIGVKLRYRTTYVGRERVMQELSKKPGGTLFLPNHPSQMDPVILMAGLWNKFRRLRPLAVDYIYDSLFVRWILQKVRAVPIPDFTFTASPFSRRRAKKVLDKVLEDLKKGDSFLIYPSGSLQKAGREQLGGASALESLLKEMPDVNLVLVRMTGLWGSSFSKASTGKVPPLVQKLKEAVRAIVYNGFFFLPRRKVLVEMEMAPPNFPRKGSRSEINSFLERWYNLPWGEGEEPLTLVSYRFWKEHHLEIYSPPPLSSRIAIEMDKIPVEVQNSIKTEIARHAHRSPEEISAEAELSRDLGMDSLDLSELIVFLSENYDVTGVNASELTTVKEAMALAAGQNIFEEEEEIAKLSLKWHRRKIRPFRFMPEGRTIPEVFLKVCDAMGGEAACADEASGVLTYSKFKTAALLLADYLRPMSAKKIGILLPSTAAAALLLFACLLAKKIPVMLNWTIGVGPLKEIVERVGVDVIMTSWKFLGALSGVDLSSLEDRMIALEDVKRNFPAKDILKAWWKSQKKAYSLIAQYGLDTLSSEDIAVLLFTSGTEGRPKGVPLTHRNLLSDQKGALAIATLMDEDVMYAFLPPFHSFGLAITTLLPLLSGVRVAFNPDPTNGPRLAKGVAKWGVTIVCGSPAFLKNLLRSGTSEQLTTMRWMVSGAEKAPQSLYEESESKGIELIEGYGATECSPIITINIPGKPPKGVGRPIPGASVIILDPDTHRPLPRGQVGLVVVFGPNVFSGYWQEEQKSPFIAYEGKQWYNTGDLGFFDEDNNLFLSGRLKRFVKIGGEMINLNYLEELLHPLVPEEEEDQESHKPMLAVIACEKEGEKSQLFVFTAFPLEGGLERVNQWLKEKGMSNLVRFSRLFSVPEIPLLGTGKIDYRQLQQEQEKQS